MQISELASATGVSVETIRYYEKQKLIPPPDRLDNGYRSYADTHLRRVSFIRHCRALDMPLDDVRQLLGFVEDPAANCSEVDHLVEEHLNRVHARLQSMRALEQQLLQLRSRCAGLTGSADCGILKELVSAARGEACACHDPAKPC